MLSMTVPPALCFPANLLPVSNYHELCIYFLMDITDTDLLTRGKQFISNEGHRIHTFEWLEFERLKDEYFYPLFLKKDIFNLPNVFTIRTEIE